MKRPLSEAQLNKIVDFDGGTWLEHNQRKMRSLKYLAALIVRNVRYGKWDVRDVKLILSIYTGRKR